MRLQPGDRSNQDIHKARICRHGVHIVAPAGEFRGIAGHQPMLNVIEIPAGIDDVRVRSALLDRGVEVAGGFGPLKGKTWRVGLMGTNADETRIQRLLGAMEEVLRAEGWRS